MNKKKTLLICLALLLVGGVVTAIIFFTEPSASRSGATKETAMLVDVERVEAGNFYPTIVATGTVQPAKDIVLSPRVSGEIIRRSEAFVPGGFVKKGEVLLQIDPADYRNTLALRRSELQQALAALEIEQGRQKVARRDLELIGETFSAENQDLVLREPQLNTVKARVQAARAAVEQARLQLERSTIRAPFDAHILSRNANEGSQVAPGDDLGRLVGREVYWVVVTVPLSQLRWLSFPDSVTERGSEVRIRDRKAWGEGIYRTGYLYKLVGALEEQTRLARLLVAVPDPLAIGEEAAGLPPLIINSFVEARITGTEIQDVVRLSRDYVRQDETAWVMKNDSLQIRALDIVMSDAEHTYIADGLQEGEQVVTTNLSTVTEGVKLRQNRAGSSATGQDSVSGTALQDQQNAQRGGGIR
jgi:RND family efflux transporter MFP subunit